jgi:CRISPR-associated protein Cmr4
MSAMMLGLLAETPIHPGSGQDNGAIDLPVQRERTTDYPVIPGS